ncbi:hypothetical protein LOZ56_006189 [Ophidiomyces ophidiicola]|nr:hypothetical protein LOZ56_006189 [Ophidiomyces ophidiicola]
MANLGASNSLIHKPSLHKGFPEIIDLSPEPHIIDSVQGHSRSNIWQAREIPFDTVPTIEAQLPRPMLPIAPDTPRHSSNVIFSFYRFLELRDLSTLPQEDVRFLEMKGCLHVPTNSILDEFIRQYFLHVHPCLPLLHEGDFWRSYYSRPGFTGKPGTISLFVFQAMLFVSCAFVPRHVVIAAGFSDVRTARNVFYNRAKLLHDLSAEHDALAKAQGAVLLTYQSSSLNFHAGSLWLNVAIQNALPLEAHNYHELDRNDSYRNTKKRLWWSILLRDRILPLGLRRPLQVSPLTYDLTLDYMSVEDLQEEIYCSEVYSVETKRHLAGVLNIQCQLVMAITDVLTAVYGANGSKKEQIMTENEFQAKMTDILKLKRNLSLWEQDAKMAFATFSGSDEVHESVVLYSELTYMYYHTALVALCHHEALLLEDNSNLIANSYEERLNTIRDDLENGALGVTKCVKRLLARGVARHLPISAVAYTALPLILYAMDVKLSRSISQSTTRKRQLKYYAEVMQLYRNRYDGTDDVAVFVREILQFVESQNPYISITPLEGDISKPSHEKRCWTDVFVRQPRFYLRISSTLDYALSRGRYPKDSDLPVVVREIPKPSASNLVPEGTLRVQEIPADSSKASPPDTTDLQGVDDIPAIDPILEAGSCAENMASINFDCSPPSSLEPGVPPQHLLPPPYENLPDVNLDFLDLGCMQGSVQAENCHQEGEIDSNIAWANIMLDEILPVVPA